MSSRTVELPELMTSAQAAAYLLTTPRTLAQDRYEGHGPRYIKDGKRIRYRAEDVRAYLEAHSVTPGD